MGGEVVVAIGGSSAMADLADDSLSHPAMAATTNTGNTATAYRIKRTGPPSNQVGRETHQVDVAIAVRNRCVTENAYRDVRSGPQP